MADACNCIVCDVPGSENIVQGIPAADKKQESKKGRLAGRGRRLPGFVRRWWLGTDRYQYPDLERQEPEIYRGFRKPYRILYYPCQCIYIFCNRWHQSLEHCTGPADRWRRCSTLRSKAGRQAAAQDHDDRSRCDGDDLVHPYDCEKYILKIFKRTKWTF